jgi:alpha/beta superfamily hydrolase
MNEERILFRSDKFSIEGLYASCDGPKGVVITHPHPMMGGSMRNNVVFALGSVFHQNGFSTLRFNFRGAGRSEGIYDNGVGEQEDVKGAIDFLSEKGKNDIFLAGYSFGAWINTRLIADQDFLSGVIMVSPPIDFLDFDFSGLKEKVGLVICGDRDQFCPIDRLKKITEEIGCRLEIVNGADHFYFGKEEGIIDYLNDYLAPKG